MMSIEEGSLEYYRAIFAEVLVDPLAYSDCKKTWRLAASLARVDVVLALLDASPNPSCIEHGLKWSAPETRPVLSAYWDALILRKNCYNPDLEQHPRRI